MLPSQPRHWAEAQAVADSQAQHLDDLEDILNSPAPALDHLATTEDLCVVCTDTRAQDSTTEALPTSTPTSAQQVQSTALLSSSAQAHDASASNMQANVTGKASEEPSHVGQLSVWNTAYQSASAPIAAVWARLPEHLQRLKPQTVSGERRLFAAVAMMCSPMPTFCYDWHIAESAGCRVQYRTKYQTALSVGAHGQEQRSHSSCHNCRSCSRRCNSRPSGHCSRYGMLCFLHKADTIMVCSSICMPGKHPCEA